MRYHFELAGMNICVEVPFELHMQQESLEFVEKWGRGDERVADVFLELKELKRLPLPKNAAGYRAGGRYFEKVEGSEWVFYSIEARSEPYACVCWNRERTVGECFYLKGKEDCLNYSRNIWDMLNMESLMLCRGGLLLHSSFIRFEGKAVLFSAPCGTGKSTQAELWRKHAGAEIINGDRSILWRNPEMERFEICGIPFCGSSGINRNVSTPLNAVIFLSQAPENRAESSLPADSVCKLFGEISINQWNPQAVQKSLDLIEQLVRSVPMIHLACNMEPDAVDTLRKMIENEK